MGQAELKCFKCSKSISVLEPVGRRESCPHCGADVRVCRNCRFYDAGAYNECKEPSADVVRDKERANFCDYFAPGIGQDRPASSASDLLSQAEALFKKK